MMTSTEINEFEEKLSFILIFSIYFGFKEAPLKFQPIFMIIHNDDDSRGDHSQW